MGNKRKARRQLVERGDASSAAGEQSGAAKTGGTIEAGGESGSGASAAGECSPATEGTGDAPAGVGPVNAQNRVDIDPAALAREADSINVPPPEVAPAGAAEPSPGADMGGDPVGTGELSLEQAMARAAPLGQKLRPAIQRIAARVLPAWNLTEQECSGLAEDVALVMVLWTPNIDALPPKWMALAALGMNVYAIADARRDTEGNFLPRAVVSAGRSSSAPSASAHAASNGAASAEGFETGSGARGFSTSA